MFDLASSYIVRSFPEADLPVAVRTTGVDPVLTETPAADFADAVARELAALLNGLEGTVAAIASPSRADEEHGRSWPPIELSANGRLVVLTALEAGLEHDGVLVVDPDAIVAESPGGERVRCTWRSPARPSAWSRSTSAVRGPGGPEPVHHASATGSSDLLEAGRARPVADHCLGVHHLLGMNTGEVLTAPGRRPGRPQGQARALLTRCRIARVASDRFCV